jgi:hypothetical protein
MTSTTAGNLCGHDPLNPRFLKSKGSLPHFIKRCHKALESFYYTPDKYLPVLRHINSEAHAQRSERRESISLVGQVLVSHLNLEDLQVGTPMDNGETLPAQATYICQKAGVRGKRAYRAIKDMIKAGYLYVHYRRAKVGGKWVSQRLIRIARTFFYDLRISNASLETAQHYKRKSLAKQKKAQSAPLYESQAEKETCKRNQGRLASMIKSALCKNEPAPAAVVAPTPKAAAPPPRPLYKRVAAKTTHDQRVKRSEERIAYSKHLMDHGLPFETVKAKTDEKYPILT